MNRTLSISIAQLNLLVGDIKGNSERILKIVKKYDKYSDIIIFSELSLTGYPPEDLIFRSDFKKDCLIQLKRIQKASKHTAIILGHPWYEKNKIFNALSFFYKEKLISRYFKQSLPNYGVFDELRYFTSVHKNCIVKFKNYRLGLLICEDIWNNKIINSIKNAGAEMLLTINASPFEIHKQKIRNNLLFYHCKKFNIPIIYLNQVGAQDELIFDGNSIILANKGKQIYQLNEFKEQIATVYFKNLTLINKNKKNKKTSYIEQTYKALVMSTYDYINKNNFNGAILGLSGGIDSSLTVTIAVDAIGKERVQAIMMPFRYTRKISILNAKIQAKLLGIKINIININSIFDEFIKLIKPIIKDIKYTVVEENIQARCRAIILMAISNKYNKLVLTTSNKSESAVGYSTLYGDLAGGFNILKDISKTLVFKLAKYRNTISTIIPKNIINRAPSAELAPRQLDQDTLPPYSVLDKILKEYIENNLSKNELIKLGFNKKIVYKIIDLIDNNEYKRRQSPIGPKITVRNFGKDRRYPITSGFKNKII
ncbi:NAD+ synthase [Candidatus Providencia siddallii]|uniref:Glutamine-dependent NAD(+) synthetase n=1 Tax=Candidatus Providencia siddallii TaxID=1715285 RepID=A0ABP1CD28_9GAMM